LFCFAFCKLPREILLGGSVLVLAEIEVEKLTHRAGKHQDIWRGGGREESQVEV
jgi:hypothetical protein